VQIAILHRHPAQFTPPRLLTQFHDSWPLFGMQMFPPKFERAVTFFVWQAQERVQTGPTPEQLRSAGLSKPKAKYVRGVAEQAADGGLPSLVDCDDLTDAEIVEKLTDLKGVGRWTVEMFLIFNLARPDVLPVQDLGVRRGFQIAYGGMKIGAGDGNRTHVASLEGWSSTIELHPQRRKL
jgi:3-methyladenine DNA glycosylase/8-oxoguanine DNA glycosylase